VGNQEAEKKVAPNYNSEIAEIQEFRYSGTKELGEITKISLLESSVC
jgi:hypothetical protein